MVCRDVSCIVLLCCLVLSVCLPRLLFSSSYEAEKKSLLELGYSFAAHDPAAVYCPVYLKKDYTYHGNWIRLYHPKTEDLFYVGTRRPIKEPEVFLAGLEKCESSVSDSSFYRIACIEGLRAWLYSEHAYCTWSKSSVSPDMRRRIVNTLKDLRKTEPDAEVLERIEVALEWEIPRNGEKAFQAHGKSSKPTVVVTASAIPLKGTSSVPTIRATTCSWFGVQQLQK